MITRAIVTGTDYNNGKIQVRIPILEGIRNTRNAVVTEYSNSSASIVCIPGIDVEYKIGDVVVIGFEDNDAGMPIVLGHLMLKGDSTPQSKVYGRFIELSASESFNAPTNTTIGNTTYQQIFDSSENATNQTNSQVKNGLSVYTTTEVLNAFTQRVVLNTALITTVSGRELQVGDLVVVSNGTSGAIYRITHINSSNVNAVLALTL